MKKSYLLVAAATLLIFGACQKEKDAEENQNSEVTQTLDDYYQENRDNSLQTFIVDANSPIEVTGEQGTTVTIPANNFLDANGNIVTGNVEVKLIEVFSKLDMLKTDITTVTTENEMLISGGEFFLDVTLPGSDIGLRPVEAMIVNVPAEVEDPNMLLWVNQGAGWELAGGADRAPDGIMEPYDDGYVAGIMSGGWYNFDFDPGGEWCEICIRVPEGSDPDRTDVFISIDGQLTMVHVDDMYYDGHSMYCTEVPVGFTLSYVVIQMDPDTGMNTYTIIESVEVECGMTIDASDLEFGSIEQMDIDIMNLP
jgi:outer membrane protein assembly factor BamB